MKKFILAAVAALSVCSAAQAATYNVGVTAQPFRDPGQPGLQTRAIVMSPSGPQNFNGSVVSIDLANIGDTFSLDLFGLVHYDAPLNADDLIHSPTSVTLDLGVFGTRVITGETYGVGVPLSPIAHAFADYFNTVGFNIGGGLRILASLADVSFGATPSGNFINGRPGFGVVTATFTLAAVPLPATLPLGLGALALMGFAARRRKDIPAV